MVFRGFPEAYVEQHGRVGEGFEFRVGGVEPPLQLHAQPFICNLPRPKWKGTITASVVHPSTETITDSTGPPSLAGLHGGVGLCRVPALHLRFG